MLRLIGVPAAFRPPVFAALVLLVLLAGLPPAASRADILINEVMAFPDRDWDGDGAFSFKGDEWIEVLNNGDQAVDLSAYFLRDVFGADPHLQLSGWLEAGQVRVWFGSQAMAWQIAHGYSDYGFALNNTGESVELLKQVDQADPGQLEVVHRVALLAHETQEDRSSGWAVESGAWALFDALNIYAGGQYPGSSGCQPTPGEPNECVPLVPVQRAGWDAVKTLYR